MPSPITIAELRALLPKPTDDLCELIVKAGQFDAAFAAIYDYMFNEDGSLTTTFQTDLCGACTTTTTTTTTETTTSTTTPTTTATTTNGCSYPDNMIPDMTSNTAPSGVAFGSPSSTDAWKAFDRDDITYFPILGDLSGVIYIGYQFTSGVTLRRLRLKASVLGTFGNIFGALTLLGSNDGVSYGTVATLSPSTLANTIDETFEFTNINTYTYYKLKIEGIGNPGASFNWSVFTVDVRECNGTTTTTTTSTSTTTTSTTTTAA